MDSSLANFVAWYAVFLFATTLHEAAHSFAAARGGDYTAYNAGQATLSPAPHIRREPIGMVLAPILSFFLYGGSWMFGWASAPYNPAWAARHPKRSFLMSLAGPLSHLPAVAVSFAAMYIGLRNGFFVYGDGMNPVAMADGGSNLAWALALLLNIVFKLNLILLVFNLLPLPPLDGSAVWYLFIKREETRLRWQYLSASYSLAGLMLAWYCFPHVFYTVYMPAVGVLRDAAVRFLFGM